MGVDFSKRRHLLLDAGSRCRAVRIEWIRGSAEDCTFVQQSLRRRSDCVLINVCFAGRGGCGRVCGLLIRRRLHGMNRSLPERSCTCARIGWSQCGRCRGLAFCSVQRNGYFGRGGIYSLIRAVNSAHQTRRSRIDRPNVQIERRRCRQPETRCAESVWEGRGRNIRFLSGWRSGCGFRHAAERICVRGRGRRTEAAACRHCPTSRGCRVCICALVGPIDRRLRPVYARRTIVRGVRHRPMARACSQNRLRRSAARTRKHSLQTVDTLAAAAFNGRVCFVRRAVGSCRSFALPVCSQFPRAQHRLPVCLETFCSGRRRLVLLIAFEPGAAHTVRHRCRTLALRSVSRLECGNCSAPRQGRAGSRTGPGCQPRAQPCSRFQRAARSHTCSQSRSRPQLRAHGNRHVEVKCSGHAKVAAKGLGDFQVWDIDSI